MCVCYVYLSDTAPQTLPSNGREPGKPWGVKQNMPMGGNSGAMTQGCAKLIHLII